MPKVKYENVVFYELVSKIKNFRHYDYTTNFRKMKSTHKRNILNGLRTEFYSMFEINRDYNQLIMQIVGGPQCKTKAEADIFLASLRNSTQQHPTAPSSTGQYQCEKCKMCFSRKYSITRHINNGRCESAVSVNNSHNMSNSHNVINTSTNTNTNSNNTLIQNNNNYTIVELGKESLSEIFTLEQQKQILRKRFNCLDYLVESVHFNEKYKQFQNVAITNINNRFAYKFSEKDNKFIMVNKESLLDDILTYRIEDITDFYENCKDDASLDKLTIESIKRFLDNIDTDQARKDKMTDVKLIMYNKRNVVNIDYGNENAII